jgi:hypothetical protein
MPAATERRAGAEAVSEDRVAMAERLLLAFGDRTGLTSARSPQRYLWTDAFAVCALLELARRKGASSYRELAVRLAEQVHRVLGRFRDDDPRRGWISGLGEEAGWSHPTAGGLRIGKRLPERGPAEPFDERLEWERDGQYYHYLTQWMHALAQLAAATGDRAYHRWAVELAVAAQRGFTHVIAGRPRLVWKASTDLSRPLQPSSGHHDPLDGWITGLVLRQSAPAGDPPRILEPALSALAALCRDGDWATEDPLGLGGLLADAWRVAQLVARGSVELGGLLERLLADAGRGLAAYVRRGGLDQPVPRRLAFRELGLAIGLHAVERLAAWSRSSPAAGERVPPLVEALARWRSLAGEIERVWSSPAHRAASAWIDHLDINEVMLATSLVPDSFLDLPAPAL